MSKSIILAAGQRVQAGPGAGCWGELAAHLLEDNSNTRYQHQAPGASFTPGQSRRRSNPWGTRRLLHERSGSSMCFVPSSCFTSRNKTQELKERDWNPVAAAKILNPLFGKWPSVYGTDSYLKHLFPISSLLGSAALSPVLQKHCPSTNSYQQ